MKPLIVFSDVTVDGFMAGADNDLGFMVDDPQLTDEHHRRWSHIVPRDGCLLDHCGRRSRRLDEHETEGRVVDGQQL
jgi:hypothetical protein